MTTHLTSAMVVSFALAMSTAQTTSQTRPAAQSAAAAKPGSLALTVVDEAGTVLAGAAVSVGGAVDRRGVTGSDGVATLTNVPAGTYRVRISRDRYISLDKEVTIRAGARLAAEAVLSAAPAAPPPPPPPKETPRPSEPAGGPVGAARVLSIPDLAEQMLRDPQPIVERDLGCSVTTASKLILFREAMASHTHADADEMLYLVAGDASLRIADKETPISAGWFGLVPRGALHSLTRRGRNAPIVLSIRSGQPCGG